MASFLDVDPITVPGQNFALLTIVPNETKTIFGVKIRGAFSSREEAAQHAQRLSAAEGARFDIYVVDMYRFLQLPPPSVNDIGAVEYSDKLLNDMIKDYEVNRAGAKALFEKRKLEILEDGLDEHLAPEERIPRPAADKLDMFSGDDPLLARRMREKKEKEEAQQAQQADQAEQEQQQQQQQAEQVSTPRGTQT